MALLEDIQAAFFADLTRKGDHFKKELFPPEKEKPGICDLIQQEYFQIKPVQKDLQLFTPHPDYPINNIKRHPSFADEREEIHRLTHLTQYLQLKKINPLLEKEYIVFEKIIPEYWENDLKKPLFDLKYLQELQLDHNIFLDGFKKTLQPVALQPTTYTEQSQEFARKMAEMEKTVSPEELNGVLHLLRIGPLLTASAVLADVLADKTKAQVSRKTTEQIDHLLAVYQGTVSEETDMGKMLNGDIPATTAVRIFDPTKDTLVDLNDLLVAGGACTKEFGTKTAEQLRYSPADCFAQDAVAGGSIHFQLKGRKGTSYNRIYIAVDHEGQPLAFYDAIESGDVGRNSLTSYAKNDLGDVLLGSFVTSIVLANRLGLERLAFGDLEMVDTARHLGFGERKVFGDAQNATQKLGYVGSSDHTGGPYLWMMQRDKKFRAINPQLLHPTALQGTVRKIYQVMERIMQSQKSLKQLREHYERYFGVAEQILEESRSLIAEEAYARLKGDLRTCYDRFGLHPTLISTYVSAVIPEPLPETAEDQLISAAA